MTDLFCLGSILVCFSPATSPLFVLMIAPLIESSSRHLSDFKVEILENNVRNTSTIHLYTNIAILYTNVNCEGLFYLKVYFNDVHIQEEDTRHYNSHMQPADDSTHSIVHNLHQI